MKENTADDPKFKVGQLVVTTNAKTITCEGVRLSPPWRISAMRFEDRGVGPSAWWYKRPGDNSWNIESALHAGEPERMERADIDVRRGPEVMEAQFRAALKIIDEATSRYRNLEQPVRGVHY